MNYTYGRQIRKERWGILSVGAAATLMLATAVLQGQTHSALDSLAGKVTLQSCVHYALTHQPSVEKSLMDEEITEKQIDSKLADWFPQVNFSYNIIHNPQLPTSIIQGSPPLKVGLTNTSTGEFSLSQTIFNRDVLLASSSAGDVRRRASEQTVMNKIDVVANVSKAFYAVLVTQEEIALLDEDVLRLERSYQDAYDQYKEGVADKTDYKRATILLNNARAERRQTAEFLKARYAFLKEQMGYPPASELTLAYNSGQMEREALLDTNQTVKLENRIEYQTLLTQKRLQEDDLDYYEWSFLPAVSLFGAYSFNYQNTGYSQLYNLDYPSSFVGLQLSFPIFQGGKRLQEIKQAKLELERFDYDFTALKNAVNTEFVNAIANYKSDLNNYRVLKENLDVAKDVYETIQLQYKAGTKTYLEVISAETDLRAAQVNRTNALYQVLSSKLDVLKALGSLQYQ
ncbi:MAG TPA: TolC family protein [Bacteroidota bacterium]|nr:TolC family protein [Bacteroidota bacterium]